MELYNKSVEIIKNNQSESGAFFASPNLNVYRYSWFRDGSWIAHSLLIVGEVESAEKFYDWASKVIISRKDKMKNSLAKHRKGIPLSDEEIIHARYNIDGTEGKKEWGNFQLDGLGVFLWCLSHHIISTRHKKDHWIFSASLLCDYLKELWNVPCCDLWESDQDKIHTSTLISIYAGLSSFSDVFPEKNLENVCKEIKDFILENCVSNGFLVKYVGSHDVDSSLIMCSVPFSFLSPDNLLVKKTIEKIIRDLKATKGLRRCINDNFYGGGEWIILGCWLGLYYLKIGKKDEAREIIEWVEKQADENYFLPEQINPVNMEDYEEWVRKWGKPANPLLWSHAMYLILKKSYISNDKTL